MNPQINGNIIKLGIEISKNARKLGSNLEGNDMNLFQSIGQSIGKFVDEKLDKCGEEVGKFLGKKEREVGDSRQIKPLDSSPPRPKVPVPVALCLVVPASVVGHLRNNNPINVSDIEKLIDNSLYFLCTTPEEADATWKRLERTDEDITSLSEQREIYVRINIDNGEEMIGKKLPYILKRNLPSNGQGMVKQLACLKYLSVSGLENFNRI